MTIAYLLVIAAAISLVLFAYSAAQHQQPQAKDIPALEPVDITAFRNLIDPEQEDYLRKNLPAHEFREVQRKRLLAAAVYVRLVKQNANLLSSIGQAAQASADRPTAEAARELVDQALQVKANAGLALLRIYCGWVWPTARISSAPILDGYDRLAGSAMLLGRLQNPAAAVRISSS